MSLATSHSSAISEAMYVSQKYETRFATATRYLRVIPWRTCVEAGRGDAAATTWIFRGDGWSET